jgi:hypothetical protein
MTRSLRTRLIAPLLSATLGLTVTVCLPVTVIVGLTATPAFAQNEPAPAEGEGESSGRSGDGYIATGCLIGLALFLIAKSARR